MITSSDIVLFYVHSDILLGVSSNQFKLLLPSFVSQAEPLPITLTVNVPSAVLNLILHAAYGIPFTQFSPSFREVSTAISSLPTFGMQIEVYVAPDTPLFNGAMLHAPFEPLQLYTLAAKFDLFPLAKAVSPHLVSIPIHLIPDDLAVRMGSVYLLKLLLLHWHRMETLKQLVTAHAPKLHSPTSFCNTKGLSMAWSFSAAALVWEAQPGMSTAMMTSILKKGEEELSCGICRQRLYEHIDEIAERWLEVATSIQ